MPELRHQDPLRREAPGKDLPPGASPVLAARTEEPRVHDTEVGERSAGVRLLGHLTPAPDPIPEVQPRGRGRLGSAEWG